MCLKLCYNVLCPGRKRRGSTYNGGRFIRRFCRVPSVKSSVQPRNPGKSRPPLANCSQIHAHRFTWFPHDSAPKNQLPLPNTVNKPRRCQSSTQRPASARGFHHLKNCPAFAFTQDRPRINDRPKIFTGFKCATWRATVFRIACFPSGFRQGFEPWSGYFSISQSSELIRRIPKNTGVFWVRLTSL